MRNTITIREAHLDDVKVLSNLMAQLGYSIAQNDIENQLQLYTSKPDYSVFVADDNDVAWALTLFIAQWATVI